MKILLATDGSEYSKMALEEIATRPFPPNSELLILSAYQRPSIIISTRAPFGGNAEYYAELDEAEQKWAQTTVDEAAKFLKDKNTPLKVTAKAVSGPPKEVILEVAKKYNADLIVVGAHGKGAISRFLIGSVSQAMALHAPCSVLIVRKKESK